MLAAIVVLPQPPLLVPELSGGAAVETEALRQACRDAGAGLAGRARRWVVVGSDPGGRRTVAPGTRGTFAGYGHDVPVALPGGGPSGGGPDGPDEGAALPLPLLVAGWLAADAGPDEMRGELVAPGTAPADCAALGAELAAAGDADTALVVLGDGAARHTTTAPGGFDERAEAFDACVAAALDDPDPDALARLDPALAVELLASGRAPWQVLAGAARGAAWTAGLRHSSIPYGVAYHVACWTPG